MSDADLHSVVDMWQKRRTGAVLMGYFLNPDALGCVWFIARER